MKVETENKLTTILEEINQNHIGADTALVQIQDLLEKANYRRYKCPDCGTENVEHFSTYSRCRKDGYIF